jgi:poly(3-hydroxybutyrate) depolymerase
MKGKIFTIILLWLSTVGMTAAGNPERKTVFTGGHEREYLVYTPRNAQTAGPEGILVALHGFNSTMYNFFEEYSITSIADALNYIIVAPQALREQDQWVRGMAAFFLGKNIELDAVWGCGLKVRIDFGTIKLLEVELNSSVDDVDFIRTVVERTLAERSMPAENIFLAGTSMGGYMAYQFATRQPVRLSGVISIAGSMGLNIKDLDGRFQTPVCDFHSTTDEVVPYTGSYREGSNVVVALARSKADVLDYWAETNGTGAPVTEKVNYYPSTTGITVDKITRPHPENEVVHYRMNGATHGYFFRRENGDCMDYVEEIGKFIASHSTNHTGVAEDVAGMQITVSPNPACDVVHFGCASGDVSVYDLTGRLVLSASFRSGSLDVSSLKRGLYVFHVRSEGRVHTEKVLLSTRY